MRSSTPLSTAPSRASTRRRSPDRVAGRPACQYETYGRGHYHETCDQARRRTLALACRRRVDAAGRTSPGRTACGIRHVLADPRRAVDARTSRPAARRRVLLDVPRAAVGVELLGIRCACGVVVPRWRVAHG